MTVAERAWLCQVSKKYARNGMNDAASRMSVKVPAPCVSTSDQLCTCRTVTTFVSSEAPTTSPVFSNFSASWRKGCRMERIFCEYFGTLSANLRSEEHTSELQSPMYLV